MSTDSGRRRDRLIRWRDWPLPTKLAAVVLIPVIFAVTLGIGQVRWQVERSEEFGRVGAVLNAIDQAEPLLTNVQDERTRAVEYLSGTADGDVVTESSRQVDAAANDVRATFAEPEEYGSVVADRYRELNGELDDLSELRDRVQQGTITAEEAIDGYGAVVDGVLALDRALASTVADQRLSSHAAALQDLLVMMEEVRLQQAWALTGLEDGMLGPQALENLQGSRARLLNKIDEAGATVAARWQDRLDQTVQSPQITDRNRMLAMIVAESMDDEYTGSYSVSPQEWSQRSDESTALIDEGHSDLADEVRDTAAQLESQASDRAGWDSVLLLAGLIGAAWVIITITRQLLRSLGQLRGSALEAADHELPEAVERIRDGARKNVELSPVPVHTTDEVGQVARAFDEVNQQALRLAAEQATLRRGYAEAFVSVSRRSQTLLERQLRLFEELEHDEEDPDQLSRLFQLDHLATRMRRNNENLMVLSGSDLARRFTQPTEVADVLRAAVSEIEQYPRVIVQPPPSIELRGHAASDLVRLFSELMDNAANFSAPDTTVTISAYQTGGGSVVVDVLDAGIGMGEDELAAANTRLAHVDENDLATSRRMGLFVAGRLAARHDIEVRLHGGRNMDGVRATVTVPPEHVVHGEPEPAWPAATPNVHPGQRNGHSTDLPTSGTLSENSGEQPSGNFFTPPPEAPPAVEPRSEPPAPEPPAPGPPAPGPGQLPRREPAASFDEQQQQQQRQQQQQQRHQQEPPSFGQGGEPPAHVAHSPSTSSDDAPTGWLFDAPMEVPEQPSEVRSDPTSDWSNGSELPRRTPRSARSENAGAQGEGEPIPEVSTEWFQPASENPYFQGRQGTERRETADEDVAWPGEADWPPDQQDSGAPGNGILSGGALSNGALAPGGESDRPPEEPDTAESSQSGRTAGDVSRKLAEMHNGVQFGRADSAPGDTDTGTWSSASLDDAQRAAEAATNPEPSSFTQAGLPRRTPKAHLVPGSAQESTENSPDTDDAPQRDAEHLRSRLTNFQSGARRGRHRAGDET